MNSLRRWLCVFSLLPWAAGALAVDLKNRSTSSSGQFIVYCDDKALRGRVVMFCEEVKADVLRVLQLRSAGTMPVVVTMDAAPRGAPPPPVVVRMVNTVAGPKIDIIVRVGDEPEQVFLQRHIIRAVLLNTMYSDRPLLKPGERYVEAPWWIVQGIIESVRRREQGADAAIFKSIANAEKLPPLDTMLTRQPITLDTPLGIVDRACALCLIEALLSMPEGAQKLAAFLSRWPDADGDVAAALKHHFPELAADANALTKWWSLQIARFAKGDHWAGMTLQDTDRELAAMLQITINTDGKGRMETFPIAEFEKFVKLPGARPALQAAQIRLVTLSTKASPLFRPILTEYEAIASALSTKKTKDIARRIAEIETYRTNLLQRMEQITDYLNWYEATQPEAAGEDFRRFLKAAAALEKKPEPLPPFDPRISEYLDMMEKELSAAPVPGEAGEPASR